MAARLPELFTQRVKGWLGQEFESFLASYEESPRAGLRVNSLKISVEELFKIAPFDYDPIPWCPTGTYLQEDDRPGKHPYYHAGLYYIQEPSAMLPVELLDVQPGDKVLDLCAAPGGKTTQIAGKLQHTGLLVANEIHPDRVKVLVRNLELAGVRQAAVFQETPDRLADKFAGFFDRILVDAPCSGEGMFRKDEAVIRSWERFGAEHYAPLQLQILHDAARMLKPGGRIVYSTCTFNPKENEEVIAAFLEAHKGFTVASQALADLSPHGACGGLRDWPGAEEVSPNLREETDKVVRLWPHRVCGEGHFAAVLQHTGSVVEAPHAAAAAVSVERLAAAEPGASLERKGHRKSAEPRGKRKAGKETAGRAAAEALTKLPDEAAAFFEQTLAEPIRGTWVQFGANLYRMPDLLPEGIWEGLKTVRPGWFVGYMKPNRFDPSTALALALTRSEVRRSLSFGAGSAEVVRYLKGETLLPEQPMDKGYVLICVDGYPLGWARSQNGILKNDYLAAWRWT
ncbi:rRNA cytosine-C5-methyltransferase [Xylanibacillus composti]|uniref:Ribosomal RNA small subunit methyltransferase F n=1 Tax=Xylanibacillus composti TaxID=1572762 RepID=A0A8J4H7I5_9BACL|nr:RsmB/NOP family class I SAM-dependent RNA methyltransferase [Xylanibacillus composti]MDT9724997.1 rRNA cytosine-C5-methyltransferase [Xylanibacillus composti]GIQ71290.1 ribosomal RNA small subunit methyltransferase F [Xylanibacillus composti]